MTTWLRAIQGLLDLESKLQESDTDKSPDALNVGSCNCGGARYHQTHKNNNYLDHLRGKLALKFSR
jgi:hypothetical protein